MKNSILILVVFLIIAVIAAMVSYTSLKGVAAKTGAISPLNKAELVFNKAMDLMDNGQKDKAAGIFKILVKQYPHSEYVEKSLRKLAAIYNDKENYAKASYFYDTLLRDFPGISDAGQIRAVIKDLNSKMLKMNTTTDKDNNLVYEVQPGDSLYVIAKKYNVTVGFIKRLNNLTSDTIRIGQKLRIDTAPFSIIVNKSRNILELYHGGELMKTYTVATGKDNCTPTGTFSIVNKVVKAAWTKPGVGVVLPDDKGYELGARWMALSMKGYGIHGTNDPNSIGKQTTAGCVRMYNPDVIELYDLVPVGTKVEIINGKS